MSGSASSGTTPPPNCSGSEPIAVRKHGRVIGFYIPVERDDADVARALAHLADTVDRVVAQTGLSEDELAELLS